MMDLIKEIKEKLDVLDEERQELEHELEVKRYQLEQIDEAIANLKKLQQQQNKEE